jgi:hypothetical protein
MIANSIAITNQMLAEATKEDDILLKVIKLINTGKGFNIDEDTKPYYDCLTQLSISSDGIIIKSDKCVIPKSLQTTCIKIAHSSHAGETKTYDLLAKKVWCPHMRSAVTNFVKQCQCQALTARTNREPLKMNPIPDHVWQIVSMDYKGPLP